MSISSLRNRRVPQYFGHDLIGGDILHLRANGADQTVMENVYGDELHIGRQHVVAASEESDRSRCRQQVLVRTWRRAMLHHLADDRQRVGSVAGSLAEGHDI